MAAGRRTDRHPHQDPHCGGSGAHRDAGGAGRAQATPAPATATPQPAAQPAAPATATPAPKVEKIAKVTADSLNIRSEPSTTGNIVKMVLAGQTFTVIGQSDDGQWLQVAENGQPLGWGAAEFMTIEEKVVETPDTGGQPTAAPTPAAILRHRPCRARILAPRPFSGGDLNWRSTTSI
ncbi:MAG: SH3 domain-containing protein [Anaerolineales bacterium]|nr:SH3 domain-containing protein [Anaerolineales bacterium]